MSDDSWRSRLLPSKFGDEGGAEVRGGSRRGRGRDELGANVRLGKGLFVHAARAASSSETARDPQQAPIPRKI